VEDGEKKQKNKIKIKQIKALNLQNRSIGKG
jgi:hypothetical protein